MAIVDIIEQQLKKSEEHDLAKRKLKEFEEGESGMLLKSLRKKRKTLDEEDKQEMRRLEKELEELKRDKNKWEDQVIYLQNKLTDNMNKDNTSEFCQKIATPFEYLPNFEELTSALFQPFNLRIPLSTSLYHKCEIACQTFSISDVETGSSEFSRICDWDLLLRNPTAI
ncbi:10418_t:CDS:2, partial [Funneliformis caledonium]